MLIVTVNGSNSENFQTVLLLFQWSVVNEDMDMRSSIPNGNFEPDNFYDFKFALLHASLLLKRGLYKRNNLLQFFFFFFFSFKVDSFSEWMPHFFFHLTLNPCPAEPGCTLFFANSVGPDQLTSSA